MKVFVSSPGDVVEERVVTRRVIDRVSAVTGASVEAVFWEHEPLLASAGFQEQIPLPEECDVVILILWSRLGTRLPRHIKRSDGSQYESGTEFEFENALESYRRNGLPDLLVYRKTARPVAHLDSEAEVLGRLQQKKALDGFLDKWFHGDDGSFTAAFHRFEKLADFEDLLETHLRKLVETRLPEDAAERVARAEWRKGSPFRGLSVFEPEHAPIFFGRTEATSQVLNALRVQAASGRPFVLILGMSGCGKSSLARAGVIPLMTQPGVIEGIGLWRLAKMRPGEASGDLYLRLASALLRDEALPELGADGTTAAELGRILRDDQEAAFPLVKGGLSQAAAELARNDGLDSQPKANLLLLVDQLEEIFTTAGVTAEERAGFLAVIDSLARSGRVWVLATLRSDFYPRCAELPVLAALKEGTGQYDLLPPSRGEIGQMIRLPAQVAGLAFEEHERTGTRLDDILRDAASRNPEVLPLLQFTLEELYKQRNEEGVLTISAYEELGGVEGALAQRAERVFGSVSPEVREALPAVLGALISVGSDQEDRPTRRRASLESFAEGSAARKLVDAFVRARLFVTDRDDEGRAIVTVAHEALLAHWPRLAEWIEHNRELLRIRARVSASTAQWEQERRSRDCLMASEKRLAQAIELLQASEIELTDSEREFIAASLARGRRAWWFKRSAVAALLVLAVVAAGAAWVANKKRVEAEAARSESEAVTGFLSSMLASVDPKKIGRDVLVRDVLDEASKSIEEDLLDEPLVQARLMLTIGDVYRNHRHVGMSTAALATLHHELGDLEEARRLKQRTLEIIENEYGSEHPKFANALNNLAALYMDLGEYDRAKEMFRRALAIREKILGPDDADLANSVSNLGTLYATTGDYEEARVLFERAFETREKVLGPEHPTVANDLNRLGILSRIMGEYEESERRFQRALAIKKKTLGPEHPEVAVVMHNFGNLYSQVGRYEEAIDILEQAIEINEKALGPDHYELAGCLNDLANVLSDVDEMDAAAELYERSLKIREKALGPDHIEVASALNNLGWLMNATGKYEKARRYLERALAIDEEALGPDHPRVANELSNLVVVHRETGDLEGALSLSERMLAIYEKAFGENHESVGSALEDIGIVLKAMGDFEKARPYYERALKIREATLGPDHPDVAKSLANSAGLLNTIGEYEEARRSYERALGITESTLGPEHSRVPLILHDLAIVCINAEEYTDARQYLERALAVRERNLDSGHPDIAGEGKRDEAHRRLREAVDGGFAGGPIEDDPAFASLRGDLEFEALAVLVQERARRQP
jgi:tetratricopeptide (TPR) repeat protein